MPTTTLQMTLICLNRSIAIEFFCFSNAFKYSFTITIVWHPLITLGASSGTFGRGVGGPRDVPTGKPISPSRKDRQVDSAPARVARLLATLNQVVCQTAHSTSKEPSHDTASSTHDRRHA